MREPEDYNPLTGLRTPYSRVPLPHLRNYALGLRSDGTAVPNGHVSRDEFCDTDFRRLYAASTLPYCCASGVMNAVNRFDKINQ